MDDLALEEADNRLGEGVVVAVADAADRRPRCRPRRGGVADREVLHAMDALRFVKPRRYRSWIREKTSRAMQGFTHRICVTEHERLLRSFSLGDGEVANGGSPPLPFITWGLLSADRQSGGS